MSVEVTITSDGPRVLVTPKGQLADVDEIREEYDDFIEKFERRNPVAVLNGTAPTFRDWVDRVYIAAGLLGYAYCAWFARCDHPATQLEPHPIYGEVPICDRCKAKVDRLSS